MTRIETTHDVTNWNMLVCLGDAMAFPSYLAPMNDDDQPDDRSAGDHPPSAEG